MRSRQSITPRCCDFADRHHDLTALRTQAVCRLHALLYLMVPGGAPRGLSAARAGQILRAVRPIELINVERRRVAMDLIGDVRRVDNQLVALNEGITEAVLASGTSLLEIHGVGPLGAAIILGHTGDVRRFPSAGHYARYNATAPIEASSGPKTQHPRFNPRGNRQLNRAMHIAAVTQIGHDTAGRIYYRRKLDEGKRPKEALRALKRRVSDVVYRHRTNEAVR